ncbi:hypothetical protein [Lacticaseibacillus parakribbianus]|uniref:hypothetical protein n=1 Tax=Lacticaseibacillus parakribbianus TaxID=2970927 RepID=UPI0021CAEA90|nr:hypothetical protein [Lacticaseibacillus parakribbianus]
MQRLLGYNSKTIRVLENLTNLLIINLLVLIASVPIVTISAGQIAGANVAQYCRRERGGHVFSLFWHYFRSNARQAVVPSILQVIGVVALMGSVASMAIVPIMVRPLYLVTLCIGIPGLFALCQCACLYQARYQGNVKQIWRNALVILVQHPAAALLLLLVNGLPVYLVLMAGVPGVVTVLFGYTFGAAGAAAWLTGIIYQKVYRKLES